MCTWSLSPISTMSRFTILCVLIFGALTIAYCQSNNDYIEICRKTLGLSDDAVGITYKEVRLFPCQLKCKAGGNTMMANIKEGESCDKYVFLPIQGKCNNGYCK